MEKEELIKKMVEEIAKLKEAIDKADLSEELVSQVRDACRDILEGEDMDKVMDALLAFAYEVGNRKYGKFKDNEDVNVLCEYMVHRAIKVFYACSSAWHIHIIAKKMGVK